MKLQQDNSDRYNITVPISLVRAKGWDKGEDLEWEINEEGDLVLND